MLVENTIARRLTHYARRRTIVCILAGLGLVCLAARAYGGGVDLEEPAPVEESQETVPVALKNLSMPPGLKALVGITGSRLDRCLTVQVLRYGKPAPGEKVSFRILVAPGKAKGHELTQTEVTTDEEGKARTEFLVGSKGGTYVVGAFYEGNLELEPVRIRVDGRASSWLMFLVFGLLGGLGIFLMGMEMAGDGLKEAAGDRMRGILSALTSNRFFGMLVGTLVTAVLQSSSATTVMLVGFVSATMMTFVQAIGVMMGAKIGTTVTAQIVAFNLSEYSLMFVALGFFLQMAGWKKGIKQAGLIILGFGLIFFGLGVMGTAMKPLRAVPAFTELLISLADQPLLGILLAIAFTAIVQSSSATIGLAIALCQSGLLSLEAGLPLAWGAHIGTCATALLSSLGASREGKQVAVSHLIYSVVGVIIAFPFLGFFVDGARWFSEAMGSTSVARQLANGHTMFTVTSALVFMPLLRQLEWATKKIVPSEDKEAAFGPKFLAETSMDIPVLALEQAHREIMRMGGIVEGMVTDSITHLKNPTEEAAELVKAEDDKVDTLEKAIRPFLARVARTGLAVELSSREHAFIYIVQELEGIGDILSKEIGVSATKLAERKLSFSEEGVNELAQFHEKIVNKYGRVMEAVEKLDRHIAEEVIQLSFKERLLERKLREAHLERLHTGEKVSVETSAIHLSVLGNLWAIGTRLEAVARTIMMEL